MPIVHRDSTFDNRIFICYYITKVLLRFNILTARKMGAENPGKNPRLKGGKESQGSLRAQVSESAARIAMMATCKETRKAALDRLNKAFPPAA